MTPTRQQQFEFQASYPAKRSLLPFFAHKFIRFLYRRGVASILHRDAVVLLTLIVLTEDQVKYSRPVGFWGSELSAMTGMTRSRLHEMVQLCVTSGWLAYCPGAKGVQATYFVQVPGGDALAMNDSPLGQDHDTNLQRGMELASHDTASAPRPSTSLNADSIAPISITPATVATDGKYAPLIAQLKRCGVDQAASCLARSLSLIDLPQITAVVSYHISRLLRDGDTEHYPYGGGAVVHRLTSPDLAALSPTAGWPKEVNAEWAKLDKQAREHRHRKAEQDRRNAEQIAREERETQQRVQAQQLELLFGDRINRWAARQPDYLWQVLAESNQFIAEWGRDAQQNPRGLASPLVRGHLLRAAELGRIAEGTG